MFCLCLHWYWINLNHVYDLFLELSVWLPSIKNMCWYAFSSCQGNFREINNHILFCIHLSNVTGDAELLEEKLLSIVEHVSNNHEFPNNKKYKKCPHPPILEERSKAWLAPGSLVSQLITLHHTFKVYDCCILNTTMHSCVIYNNHVC